MVPSKYVNLYKFLIKGNTLQFIINLISDNLEYNRRKILIPALIIFASIFILSLM